MIWVVGRGGLLGSALEAALREDPAASAYGRCWHPAVPYRWQDPDDVAAALTRDARAFRGATHGARWCVAWCAGREVVGSTDAQMAAQWRLIEAMLTGLEGGEPGEVRRGMVCFASSAGAIYGPGTGRLMDEASPVAPTTDYGRGKLDHEARLARWATTHGVALRVARITTLVGPGQALDKGQGLVSLLARATQTRTPLNVFVPLATARNYVPVRDAARILARWLAAGAAGTPDVRTKIVCAPRSTSVATLLRQFADVTRRRAPVTLSGRPGAGAQSGLAAFRSIVDVDADRIAPTPLPVALRGVIDAARVGFVAQGSRNSTTR
jgi:UDP-glucose 4-epimerase